jgi:transcriptional regulator with XRE-family HTH domain
MLAEPSASPPPGGARDLARQELARRLAKALQDRDMNQSDLARASGLPRELISTYVRGVSFPTPKSLRRICDALHMKPDDLVPASMGMVAQDEVPAFAMTEIAGQRGAVWLRVNRMVPASAAAKIFAILQEIQE